MFQSHIVGQTCIGSNDCSKLEDRLLFNMQLSHKSENTTDFSVENSDLVEESRERAEAEFQMGWRVLNACLAFLIWLLMSSSVPPSLLTTLPR